MKESERILFTDFLASMDKKFIESGWITVSAECLHSALVSDEKLSDVLSRYEWDLIRGSNGVSEIWSNGKWSFCHEGIDVLEPFVRIPVDTRSLIPVISVHSISNLQYRRQS